MTAAVVLALVAGGVSIGPASAEAATKPSVRADATIGTDRVVTLRIGCTAATTCRGAIALKLSTGGKKKLSYRIAKHSAKTLSWTLSAGAYRAFATRGSAKLTVTGTAVSPAKRSFAESRTVTPAKPRLSLASASYAIAKDRRLPLALTCSASAGCGAKVSLQLVADAPSGAAYLTVASTTVRSTKAGSASAILTLPDDAYAALGEVSARVLIAETRPDAVQAIRPIELTRAAPVRTASVAYAQRNWTPTEYDTCPASLHESYRTVGPDGKYYPTWHPPQVTDPATGRICSFGHEHGADPTTSDIYAWVAGHYAPADRVEGEPEGLPFGYASEELNNHISAGHGDMAMRHEDNGGHKVFVRNDVGLLDGDHRSVTFENAEGKRERVVCDFLIKAHQGSWSADATANNAHELFYAVKCNDGTELISTTLSLYGNPNGFRRSCAPGSAVATVGSMLPPATTAGGSRAIPDRGCAADAVSGASDVWALYEVWESANELTTADGRVLASFDPWFGVRNPSRYYDSRYSSATVNGIGHPIDLLWEESSTAKAASVYPWSTVAGVERFDYRDPRSPFDGAQRDFYIGQSSVTGIAGSPVFYTDPYGGSARTDRVAGSIAQWAVAGSMAPGIELERQQFDLSADWGKSNGVHAPN